MNEEILKALLIRDKGFLYSLYEGENILRKKRTIYCANDSQLNTLIKYLHYVACGKIPILKLNFEKIPSSKLKLIKTKLEKSFKFDHMLSSDREIKVQFLLKLINIYSHLLYICFNETNNGL